MGLIKIAVIGMLLAAAFAAGVYVGAVTLPRWSEQARERVQDIGIVGLAVETPEENVSEAYAWTTALCGADGRCIDVLVECNGTQILNVSPTSNVVAHAEEWQDPRGGNPARLCFGSNASLGTGSS